MENNNIKEQVAEGNGAQFKHTPGPWSTDGKTTHVIGNGFIVASVQAGLNPQIQFANAQRIVECVNAMQGIDEPQKLRETWDAIQHLELDAYVSMKAQRDDLLYVLREVEKHHKSQNSEIGNKLRKVIEIVDLTKEIEEGGDGE